jgi:small-conductance mechanosensitive channel
LSSREIEALLQGAGGPDSLRRDELAKVVREQAEKIEAWSKTIRAQTAALSEQHAKFVKLEAVYAKTTETAADRDKDLRVALADARVLRTQIENLEKSMVEADARNEELRVDGERLSWLERLTMQSFEVTSKDGMGSLFRYRPTMKASLREVLDATRGAGDAEEIQEMRSEGEGDGEEHEEQSRDLYGEKRGKREGVSKKKAR